MKKKLTLILICILLVIVVDCSHKPKIDIVIIDDENVDNFIATMVLTGEYKSISAHNRNDNKWEVVLVYKE